MNPVRFSANLGWLFTEVPLPDRFAAAAAAGFRGVELGVPYPLSTAAITAALDEHDQELVLINTPVSDDHPWGTACLAGPQFRTDLQRAVELAVATGCPRIHVVGGTVPDGVVRDRALDTYRQNLAWAAAFAPAGVTLLVEVLNQVDVPGFVLHSLSEAIAVLDEINSPRLGLMLDLYHCRITEGEVLGPLHEYLPRAGHVQFAQAPGRTEPADGDVDWPVVFDHLARHWPGWVGCEYRPSTDTLTSLAWMNRSLPPAAKPPAAKPPAVERPAP